MGYIDLKISRIRAYNKVNGRHERMMKLKAKASATAVPLQHSSGYSTTSNDTTEDVIQKRRPNYMNWELRKAAEEGDVERFLSILEKLSTESEFQLDTILEQTSFNGGNTYLHLAAKSGGSELIGLLTIISDESLMIQPNDEGDTALHIAVKVGHLAVTDLLIRHGQEFFLDHLYVRNNKGNTPLHEALLHNHQHLVDLLLQFDPHCSFYVNNEGKSSFYLSIEAGDIHAFNLMLKQDFWTSTDHMYRILDEQLMKGKSLLHAAIARQDKVMLQKVLAKGMHMLLHVKDENGQSPIEFASRIGFDEGQKILLDELSKDTTITGDVDINQQVLDHNPDAPFSSWVEVYDEEGLIQSAAWEGRHERMRKLLENVMKPEQQGMSPHYCMDLGLFEAARNGDVDKFITELEQYSAERNLALPTILSQLTPLQNTFLHVASSFGHKDLSSLIIWYFPRLFGRANSHGNTALHLASIEGWLGMVKIFVTFRNHMQISKLPVITLDINDGTYTKEGMQMITENGDGRTPLQVALKARHKAIIEFMIKENVEEAYHVNSRGTSSLYMVILDGDIKQLKNILITVSHYVDQTVLDRLLMKGKSLVLAAIWSQKTEILQELARQKPVLFEVKDEHAQKLVHFAELLGFHEGAHYLHSEFKLEIILDSTDAGVTPELPVHSYSLDAYSISVMETVDQKIEEISQSMNQNGRDERIRKLLGKNSIKHTHQQNQQEQFMDIKLYEAAQKGDVDSFIASLEKVLEANNQSLHTISKQTTRIGNTFLHVAVSCGNEDLTSFIVFYFRDLLMVSNKKGDTADHEAARAGHLGIIDILVRFHNYDDQRNSFKEYDTIGYWNRSKWCSKNFAGNTSLHEAFFNYQRKVVDYLINSRVEEAYHVNQEGKSVLYLAVEADMVDTVKTILSNMVSDVNMISDVFTTGKSLTNVALRRKSTVMLQEISRVYPALVHAVDEDGQTAVFCSVATGFQEGLNWLIDELKMDISQTNSMGFFLVHVASICGHVHILQKLMQTCPDAGSFRNRKGQNILHVAAMYGKENVVKFILQSPDLVHLLNEADDECNTPLHLATINWHPKIVSCLTWDPRVNLNLVNNDGLTSLDAAEVGMEAVTSFQQRLTWSALMSAGTQRAVIGNLPNRDRISSKKHDISAKDERFHVDHSKDRVNTLLLVATLVATVTFAAGFTIPGGYNNSEPNQGQSTMLHNMKLQIFVVCDTIALYSAIMVAVTLIWAQLGDLTLVVNALSFALPLLGLSLTTMSVAFMVGLSLVVGDLTWLANFVLIFGIVCLASVLALFTPLCLPYSSPSPVLRYITYYPFRLLVLASRSSDD